MSSVTVSADSPKTCVLLAILEVFFSFNQLQGLPPDLFIVHFIGQLPKTLNDVVTDQGAILFRDALFEATCETVNQLLLLILSGDAKFP